MNGQLRITLVRGLSGRTEYHRRVVKGLGLTRVNRPGCTDTGFPG